MGKAICRNKEMIAHDRSYDLWIYISLCFLCLVSGLCVADRAGVLGNSRLMACHKNIAQYTPLKGEKIVKRGHVGRI